MRFFECTYSIRDICKTMRQKLFMSRPSTMLSQLMRQRGFVSPSLSLGSVLSPISATLQETQQWMDWTKAAVMIGAGSRPSMQSQKRNLSSPPFSGYHTALSDFIPTEIAKTVSETLPPGHSSWKDATGNCSSLFVLILNILNWLPRSLPLPTAFPCCSVSYHLPPSTHMLS